MRYITIAPDYTGSCIRDDFNGQLDLTDLDLPEDFIKEISMWHELYKEIIPLSEEQREDREKDINVLDFQGLRLAEKLKELMSRDIKVRYFSEGKLTYLPVK
jgi:hypothetical protein